MAEAQRRLDQRFTGCSDKLFGVWQHTGLHALYDRRDPMATLSADLKLNEQVLDMSNLSPEQAAYVIVEQLTS